MGGDFRKDISGRPEHPQEVVKILSEIRDSENIGKNGEVVFSEDVSLDSLQEIWIHPIQRNMLLDMLKKQGVYEFHNIPIEYFMKSPTLHP